MKKPIYIILCFCVISTLLFSCAESIDETETDVAFSLTLKTSEDYTLVETNLSKFNFTKPCGILFNNNQYLVVDAGENLIQIFDNNGDYKKSVGSTGNGNLQFLNPTSIIFRDGYYYVLDSGNSRVQILNEDFTYDSQRVIPKIPSNEPYNDIAVDENGKVFVTTFYGIDQYAYCYAISESGLITQLGENLIGFLAQDSQNIYVQNTAEAINDTFESGKSTLFTINDNTLKPIFEVPYKYTPFDFLKGDVSFFMFGGAMCTLDEFDLDGNYIKTLFKFEVEIGKNIRYICSDKNQSVFYLSSPTNSRVYCVKKTQN